MATSDTFDAESWQKLLPRVRLIFLGKAYLPGTEDDGLDNLLGENQSNRDSWEEHLDDAIFKAIGRVLNKEELNAQMNPGSIGEDLAEATVHLHRLTSMSGASRLDRLVHHSLNALLEGYSTTAEALAELQEEGRRAAHEISATRIVRRVRESDLHDEIGEWLWNQHRHGRLVFVDNRHPRSSIEDMSAAGESDMLVWHKGIAYAIELKTPHGSIQPNQGVWRDRFEQQGGEYFVATSLAEVKARLQ